MTSEVSHANSNRKDGKVIPADDAMGFMIVLISVIVGYLNAQTASVYFAADKATRETAMMMERAAIGNSLDA